jgi:hypothetical protein
MMVELRTAADGGEPAALPMPLEVAASEDTAAIQVAGAAPFWRRTLGIDRVVPQARHAVGCGRFVVLTLEDVPAGGPSAARPRPRSAETSGDHMLIRTIILLLSIALFSAEALAQKAKKAGQRSDPSRSNIEMGSAPKEGTPEWRALEARKKAEQDRMDRAMRNVCRGC